VEATESTIVDEQVEQVEQVEAAVDAVAADDKE
jgi:hypothetical protein